MFALEIINALNDLNNPVKPKGLNLKLKTVDIVEPICRCGFNEADHELFGCAFEPLE